MATTDPAGAFMVWWVPDSRRPWSWVSWLASAASAEVWASMSRVSTRLSPGTGLVSLSTRTGLLAASTSIFSMPGVPRSSSS